MKILFIASGRGEDYLCDMLFHGLKTLFGSSIYESNDLWYMYENITIDQKKKLYGLGFTIYGLLPENLKNIDIEIDKRIQSRYYDIVVYGSIRRDQSYLSLVRQHYNPSEVAFVDGEDLTDIDLNILGLGSYFKRECISLVPNPLMPHLKIHPINIVIPEQHVLERVPPKARDWSLVTPTANKNYKHNDQLDYYQDYILGH